MKVEGNKTWKENARGARARSKAEKATKG